MIRIMKATHKRFGLLHQVVALSVFLSAATGCGDSARATKERQRQLAAVEARVARAGLGTLVAHRVGGREAVSGDKPFRTSYYARGEQSADQVKAALSSAGFVPVRIGQRCNQTDPCAFTDPDHENALLSVVLAPSSAVVRVDKVKLPDGDVVVVSVF